MPDVILKPKEDRRLRAGHLWVFNNEIAKVRGDVENGEVVTVVTSDGRPVGTGYYNKHSLIALRLLTRGRERCPSPEDEHADLREGAHPQQVPDRSRRRACEPRRSTRRGARRLHAAAPTASAGRS